MELRRAVEAFLRRSGMPPSRFGREAVGDPCFVADLRSGREPRATTTRRVRTYIGAMEKSVGAAVSPRPRPSS